MTGSGIGMTYDQDDDVLSLSLEQAHVQTDRRERRHADGVHGRLRGARIGSRTC